MGAEGKYDIKLAPGYDVETATTSKCCSSNKQKNEKDKQSVLTSRKSSSTPSLPEATDVKTSVASTEQAASADNLAAKQAAETIAESVLSVARNEALVAVTSESQAASNDSELSVVVHPLRDPHHDLSTINNSTDLATIVESLALCESKPLPANSSDTQKAMVSSNSNSNISKSNRSSKINNSQAAAAAQSFVEAVEALDKIREGSDMLRNNTNNFLSAELLQSALNIGQSSQINTLSSLNSVGVRISVSSNSETDDEKPVRRKTESAKSGSCSSDKDEAVTNSNNAKNSSNNTIVVTNPMSVSVPNLTSTEANSQIEPTTTAGTYHFFIFHFEFP